MLWQKSEKTDFSDNHGQKYWHFYAFERILVTTSEDYALFIVYETTDIHVGHSLVEDLRLRSLGSWI